MQTWELLLGVLVCVSAVMVPMTLAFPDLFTGEPVTAYMYAVDLVFLVDVLVSFRTAYDNHGRRVRDPRLIAARYLRGWFALDICAGFPIQLVMFLVREAEGKDLPVEKQGAAQVNKLVRMLRLTKVLRLLRIVRLVTLMGLDLTLIPALTQPLPASLLLFVEPRPHPTIPRPLTVNRTRTPAVIKLPPVPTG